MSHISHLAPSQIEEKFRGKKIHNFFEILKEKSVIFAPMRSVLLHLFAIKTKKLDFEVAP